METNDYDFDCEFGSWLRDQRVSAKMDLKQASLMSGIKMERLKALEVGYADKGITYAESEKLSNLYKIVLKVMLSRASGDAK